MSCPELVKAYEESLATKVEKEKGFFENKKNGFHYYPVDTVDVFDLSGAGDTFHAALVKKYLETTDIDISIKYANRCASEVVQKRGVVSSIRQNEA